MTSDSCDAVRALAAALPRGYQDLGFEQAQAGMCISYDAGDDVWEIEWCALDGERNFTLQDRELDAALTRAKERAGV